MKRLLGPGPALLLGFGGPTWLRYVRRWWARARPRLRLKLTPLSVLIGLFGLVGLVLVWFPTLLPQNGHGCLWTPCEVGNRTIALLCASPW